MKDGAIARGHGVYTTELVRIIPTREPLSKTLKPLHCCLVRFGGCLFRYRTSIPVPIVIALLLLPAPHLAHPLFFDAAGIALVALGELIRLWAVRHIGVISRTRSDRLGPLVSTGPFALVRN